MMRKILYGIALILFGLCCCTLSNGFLGAVGITLATVGVTVASVGFFGDKPMRKILDKLFGEE